MTFTRRGQSGFTLPELLVFCLVVGLLLGCALKVAHLQNFTAQRHNAERWVAVAQQMQLLHKYVVAKGTLPDVITQERQAVGSEEGMADLCPYLVPEFTKDLLYDPFFGRLETKGDCHDDGALYTTGIAVIKTKDNTVTVSAPGAELNQKISLTRKF
jgi:type II secretory pathway pseudopilin PulG